MKKWAELALGIITGIGGFLEIGSIATAAQAGAEFRTQHLWVVALGAICLAVLMEMTGRLAAVSQRTYVDLLRGHFGLRFFMIPMLAVLLVSFLALASEIGGVAYALQLASGIDVRWLAFPIAIAALVLLWRGTFGIVEQGTAMLGLVAIAFAIAAVKLHPQWHRVAHGLIPSAPTHSHARYWYLCVSILGASISPYLYLFYSAGAKEDGWTLEHLGVNRATALLGNLFGGGLALAVLICAAYVLAPRGLKAEQFDTLAMLLQSPLGKVGFVCFIATMCVTCFGATVEITLASAYLLAQGYGWAWSENLKPGKDARFSVAYVLILLLAAIPITLGADVLALTNISMVATAASLPLSVVPLLVLMNDEDVMRVHCNGTLANAALVVIAALSVVLFVAAIPLQVTGGG